MEIISGIVGILALGLVYFIGYYKGTHVGFCAREYHNPVVIVATIHENTIIAHDFTDKSFLAQANSIAELGDIMKKIYPDKTIVIAENI